MRNKNLSQGECIEDSPYSAEVPAIRRKNNRLMRRHYHDRFWHPFLAHHFYYPVLDRVRLPTIDFRFKGDKFVLVAELPGVQKDNVDISLTDSRILIKANHQEESIDEDECYVYQERTSDKFHRVLEFPEEIESDKVEAKLENGILTIELPKKVPESKKKVKKLDIM